jgi:hypothetical protein
MLASLEGVVVANSYQMRERASRLFAMALNARDKGQIEYADKLTKQAADILDEATAAETSSTQNPEPPQQAAQQPQQPQPKKN